MLTLKIVECSTFRYTDSDTVQHFGNTEVLTHSCFTSDDCSGYDLLILQAWRIQVGKYTMWPPEHSEKGRKLDRCTHVRAGVTNASSIQHGRHGPADLIFENVKCGRRLFLITHHHTHAIAV